MLFIIALGILSFFLISDVYKCFLKTGNCKLFQILKEIVFDLLGYNLVKLLFLASVVFLIHHKTDLLKPFDDMSIALIDILSEDEIQITSNLKSIPTFSVALNSDRNKKKQKFYVIVINKTVYLDTFLGISPLDRCALSAVLSNILKKKPKLLAIDIDLSPICSNNKENSIYSYYENCQRKLDKILKSYAQKTKIILIDPYKFQEFNNNCLSSWKEEMKNAGIVFADPTVSTSLGIALYYPIDFPSLGKKVTEYLESERKDSHEHYHSKIPINFKIEVEKVTDIKQHSVVFFGGAYSSLDKFETPIGKFPGVFIHAFGALSILNPAKENGLLAYAADVTIAILTFIMINYILLRSFSKYEKKKGNILSCIRNFFYNTYSIILSATFLITFISLVVTVVLYKHFSILISPIPIIIGVFLDGLFGIVLENLEKHSPSHSFSRFSTYCKAGIMLSFIAYSPFFIVHRPELFVIFILIPGLFIFKISKSICQNPLEE